jgi:Flp pilus assembly protein TadB
MAQTKKKRRTKHRGTQAGTIETRGRTSRPTSRAQARQQAMQRSQNRKVERASAEPTWRGATIRAGVAAAIFFALLLVMKQPIGGAVAISIVMFGAYVPMGYYTDVFLHNRRRRREAEAAARRAAEKAEEKAAKKTPKSG